MVADPAEASITSIAELLMDLEQKCTYRRFQHHKNYWKKLSLKKMEITFDRFISVRMKMYSIRLFKLKSLDILF